MEIKHTAIAGTLESSDIQIMLSKIEGPTEIELESAVEKQFGTQIRTLMRTILEQYGITNVKLKAVDKGALDCTIKARLITAIQRAIDKQNDPDWEVLG
ncbi:citrate lyase acyl carrier protein [Lactobacillus curvatus]|uniref:Citrate lyase acyl carrier protein n=2 Tax=Latilactobacillus graminis TaxID=60519 RepID=A0AA89I339_9LACO|nr:MULTISPECIES: citrate lyase acyl carrier protein [Latilactobacillus]KRM23999.1 hypothetical protein FC90_GL001240 [Latilactobacillus graminis DSM 20719]MSD83721.1 citrate lyase acyl carrier protein [Latilactobacillus curvatus]MSE23914.1 citrate lyase acyl carrier protein [Latilactobacillus curvatus]QFP79837.1 citrate lyase acyl carrier protein [Latilactobacillus graminis]